MATDIFSTDPVELELGFNDLVGDDKKYKDPDGLAKAYANIERHARTLEAEAAKLRAEKDADEANRSRVQEPRENEQPKQPDPAPASTPPQAPNKEDFRTQIREELTQLNEVEKAKKNIEAAANRLVDLYGSPAAANEAIRKRASELGVSVERLRDSASESPQMFYASMGIGTQGASHNTPTPNNEVNLRDGAQGVKNFEYFDKLRKDNSKLYFTPAVQKEMMNAARTLGADFYKR